MVSFHLHESQPCCGEMACVTQWSYEPSHARPPKTDRSQWRVLTKCGPLAEEVANFSSIIASRTLWTVKKNDKKIWYQKMSPSRYRGVQHATEEEQRAITNSSRKKEVARPKWKWHSIVDVSSGESKVQWCKEQYCKGNWNVRSMKLDMVKQEMARVNLDILRISELKWMGMGEFNSDDHYIYYCE